jgi:hypothetical protein
MSPLRQLRDGAIVGQRAKTVCDLRSMALWVLWLGLAIVWVSTLVSLSDQGSMGHWFQAALIVALLYVLFFAEGIELAVADLLDKHPEQLADEHLQRLLVELQDRRDFFFSTRQVFVVLIITYTSLSTTYPYVFVPFVGKVTGYEAPFWFSLLFTSLSILWFCQVTPKRLAVVNSELFLRQSAFLWPIIRFVGIFGLPSPSDQLVDLSRRFTSYRQNRHLRPSPASHYNSTSHIYGLAADRIGVNVEIGVDGTVTVRKRFLMLIMHGRRSQFSDRIYCPAPNAGPPRVRVLSLHVGEAPERLEQIGQDLDAMFAGEPLPASSTFVGVAGWNHRVDVSVEPDVFRGGVWESWTIWSGAPLPEAFRPAPAGLAPIICALVYEAISTTDEASLFPIDAHPYDRVWSEPIISPCRLYSLQVSHAEGDPSIGFQGCEVKLAQGGTVLVEETFRCSQEVIASVGGSVAFNYPLQGAVYSTRWWRLDRRDPALERDTVRSIGHAT